MQTPYLKVEGELSMELKVLLLLLMVTVISVVIHSWDAVELFSTLKSERPGTVQAGVGWV